MTRFSSFLALVFVLTGCAAAEPPPLAVGDEVGSVTSLLTPAERRVRAGQIRDAAFANGMTQGWLLAGIADAETQMSHCWSELTWACMGPNSPDCGGGPVVAGAGDGPCSARQGGLGMFQFDAGTFEDTLRREGDRVLYIDGNVAAAVDFVVAMVIRSTYISGVDNAAQAIEWMNGVRIGNGRWHPWIQTVTHYYNGCVPGRCGVYDSRYEHYRSNTANVYDEMGADFWAVDQWSAQWVSQSFPLARDPFELAPGEEVAGNIVLRNTGTQNWTPGMTFLGTTEPRDVASPIAASDWPSPNRAATVDRVVAPGEMGTFAFSVRGPDTPGDYPQFFNLVQETVAWFGMPGDDQLQVRVTVVAGSCPDGVGSEWTCDGSSRVRCVTGSVERQDCPGSCTAGACDGVPGDEDGDGHNTSVDCDDTNPDVHPGADDPCGDGLDANCDGNDVCPGGDGGMSGGDGGMGDVDAGPMGGPMVVGGCAAGGGASAGWLGLVLLFGVRRRR